VPAFDRQSQLRKRPAQMLQQERAAPDIRPEQPGAPASRSAVASCAAAWPSRGTISFSTALAPSSHTASATNASVESL